MAKDVASEQGPQGLSYVTDRDPGLRRKPARASGFNYLTAEGHPLTDGQTLDRIRVLAIPPAWTNVWISSDASGHIQATGRDHRGRKQYRYHLGWAAARAAGKFDRVIAFGRALPRLRTRVDSDLARRGLPRDKVLAAVVRTMEVTLIRVGNEEYAKHNKSFGLTTLRNRHARVGSDKAVFEFRGKSGKVHTTGFSDRRLARVVKACQDLPGQRLFQYLDDDGQRRAVESNDVNGYIRETLGEDFSAKDFRTWAGTVAAAHTLASPECAALAGAPRGVNACVKAVASLLGNTAAVARSAYIHPAVLEAYANGKLNLNPGKENRAFELAVLRFLENAQ